MPKTAPIIPKSMTIMIDARAVPQPIPAIASMVIRSTLIRFLLGCPQWGHSGAFLDMEPLQAGHSVRCLLCGGSWVMVKFLSIVLYLITFESTCVNWGKTIVRIFL